jgi:predicted nucleic acid-binding protein
MTILVDTSVWSLALRRDADAGHPEVQALKEALLGDEVIVTTGFVLQELLEGFSGPKAQAQIVERLSALPLIQPDRDDHVAAAGIRNACRRGGVQLGTIDALLARLCIRHMLTPVDYRQRLRARREALSPVCLAIQSTDKRSS